MARLLVLDGRGELTTEHARLAAAGAGVTLRTVWRWLQVARVEGRAGPKQRGRFTITPELHARLALWGGNAAAVHRELLAETRAVSPDGAACAGGGGKGGLGEGTGPGSALCVLVPSLATLQRAVRRDLNAGQRAGLRGGERARRLHDVHLRRPRQWRNACWEADHKHLPVEVALDGRLACPWVTWFIDCATNAITGAAVTPHQPSRDAVLAALRIALSRGGPYGPVGGLPDLIRVDQGADFLSRTVAAALGAFAVPVQPLPPYRPDLKGTVENLNRCVVRMFCAPLPRYTHAPTATPRRRTGDIGPPCEPLPFTAFTALLLEWVDTWNTGHLSQPLDGRTPLEAWEADPTPVEDVDPGLLWAFTLEDDGRIRTLNASGIRWGNRYYVAPWMNGMDRTRVRVRWIPHHDHEIEVFDAATHRHLGTAHLADQATKAQRVELRRAKDTERRVLARALRKADTLRRQRYEAVTEAKQPEQLGALTTAEAGRELTRSYGADLAARALPDLVPPREPPPGWARPVTRPAGGAPAPTGAADEEG
ncbi:MULTISPECIES: Mu transposase C-terminal domain-containing protein [unclassified Streptomyces]|uniref:Mu transposase C-terminal domain-containing protein n=1 Tax=unclassified Streptomyces TaxID=2593676 RepID=UPI0037FE7104